MKAEEYLQQVEKKQRMIDNKRIEVAKWKDKAEGNTGQAEGERVQSSGDKQKMANAVNTYTDLEKEIDALQAEVDAVIKTIEQLPTKQYDLLHKRYVQGIPLKAIAMEKKKSTSWVYGLHKKALFGVESILKGGQHG